MNNKLQLKSVYEILDYNFFIPSFQRGYKWDKQQVLDLLNDIYEFSQTNELWQTKNCVFYCLQPLVVKPHKWKDENNEYIEGFSVIDGQQRLTTIYIILKYLEEARKIIFNDDKLFLLEYETRSNIKKFLKNYLYNGIDKSNPDFYYMSSAYQTIKQWFEDKKINKADFLNILLKHKKDENGNDTEKNVRFIWYELPDNEDEIKVFTRLNIGKIPLSNSELIKAILLYQLADNEKFEMISEWDYIEKNLQNDRFFSFVTKKDYKNTNTKIDFIFDLIAKNYNEKFNFQFKEDGRFSFYAFNKLLKEKIKTQKELWSEVKEYFRVFEELYNDNEYYHYVGYLTNIGYDIDKIVKDFKDTKKDTFKSSLKEKMKIKLKIPLEKLEYDSNYKEIEKLLFLFNVLITKESGYSRYPFDIHNNEKWSLEHIHAQNSQDLQKKQKIELLVNQLKSPYIKKKIKEKIKELLKKFDDNEFNKIQEEIYKEFTDEKEEIHTIDNLALLSKEDNSFLNNSIFPEKRKKIKKLDKQGKFIPLGTKNVFMKYYSDEVDEFLTWNSSDRKYYLKVLKEKLTSFVKVEK